VWGPYIDSLNCVQARLYWTVCSLSILIHWTVYRPVYIEQCAACLYWLIELFTGPSILSNVPSIYIDSLTCVYACLVYIKQCTAYLYWFIELCTTRLYWTMYRSSILINWTVYRPVYIEQCTVRLYWFIELCTGPSYWFIELCTGPSKLNSVGPVYWFIELCTGPSILNSVPPVYIDSSNYAQARSGGFGKWAGLYSGELWGETNGTDSGLYQTSSIL